MYYFAYGSNNPDQMADRLGHPVDLVGLAILPHRRFVYQGRSNKWRCGTANVVPEFGSDVYGVLYAGLSEEDLQMLDSFEAVKVEAGAQVGRYKRVNSVVFSGADKVRAAMYVMTGYLPVDRQLYPPSTKYFRAVLGSAQAAGFPESYVSSVLTPELVWDPVPAPGYSL